MCTLGFITVTVPFQLVEIVLAPTAASKAFGIALVAKLGNWTHPSSI